MVCNRSDSSVKKCYIMFLSDWHVNWKEKRIQGTVETSKAEAYEG